MTRNVAASIHQRLLNHARAGKRPFNQVLQRFALERFIAWDAHRTANSLCSRER